MNTHKHDPFYYDNTPEIANAIHLQATQPREDKEVPKLVQDVLDAARANLSEKLAPSVIQKKD